MKFDSIKEQSGKYVMDTYGRYDVCIVSGKNARCTDADGKEYIDMGSGIGVNALGFSDEGWADAVCKQAHKLQHTSNLYYTEPYIEAAKLLCEATGMDKVFFANSGAEANEGAIKLARKRSFDKYGKGRGEIITLLNSFHGRTITTLAATGQDVFHNFFFPFTEGFVFAEAGNIEDVKSKIGDKTCGIMIELVQGEGGVMPLPEQFVRDIEALCRAHDLCLIVDEVQTGIGRTGSLFCYQQYGIHPHVVTCAKGIGGGLPLGAVLADVSVSATLGRTHHATTFGGNPVACAGAVYVLGKVSDPSFLAEVKSKSDYLVGKLLSLPGVKDVRGRGLMLGIELEDELSASEIVVECAKRGLLILTAKTVIRLLPPLTIEKQDMDDAVSILQDVLKEKLR